MAARIRLTEVLKKGGESMKTKLVTLTVFVAGMFLTSVALAAFLGSPPLKQCMIIVKPDY